MMNKQPWKWKIGRLAYWPGGVRMDGFRRIGCGLFWQIVFKEHTVVQIDPRCHDKFGGCLLIVECMLERSGKVYGNVLAPSNQGTVSMSAEFPAQWCRRVGKAHWANVGGEKPVRT